MLRTVVVLLASLLLTASGTTALSTTVPASSAAASPQARIENAYASLEEVGAIRLLDAFTPALVGKSTWSVPRRHA